MAYVSHQGRYGGDVWRSQGDYPSNYRRGADYDGPQHPADRYSLDDLRYSESKYIDGGRLPRRGAEITRSVSMRDNFSEPIDRAPRYASRKIDREVGSGPLVRDVKAVPGRDIYESELPYRRSQSTREEQLSHRYNSNNRERYLSPSREPAFDQRRFASEPHRSSGAIVEEYLPQQPNYQRAPRTPSQKLPYPETPGSYKIRDQFHSHRDDATFRRPLTKEDVRRFQSEPGRGAPDHRMKRNADIKYSRHYNEELDYKYSMDRRIPEDYPSTHGFDDRYQRRIMKEPMVAATPYRDSYGRSGRYSDYPMPDEPIVTHRSDPLPRGGYNYDDDAYYRDDDHYRQSSAPPSYRKERYRPDPRDRADQYGSRDYLSNQPQHDDFRESNSKSFMTPIHEGNARMDKFVDTSYFSKPAASTSKPPPASVGEPIHSQMAESSSQVVARQSSNNYMPTLNENEALDYSNIDQLAHVPTRAVAPPPPSWQRCAIQFVDAEFDFPAVTNPRGWAKAFELSFSSSYGSNVESSEGIGSWTGTGDRGLAKIGSQLDPQRSHMYPGGQYAWLSSGATLYQQLVLEPGDYHLKLVLGRPLSDNGSGNMLLIKTSLVGLGPREAQKSEKKLLSSLVGSKQWFNAETSSFTQPVSEPCSVNFEFITQATCNTVGTSCARTLIKQVHLYFRSPQLMGSVYM